MGDENREPDIELMMPVFQLQAEPAGSGRSARTSTPEDAGMCTLLLQGHNTSGEEVYAYIHLPLERIAEIRKALGDGEHFIPSEFGTVIAAGRGQPTDEVKAEIAENHFMVYFDPQGLGGAGEIQGGPGGASTAPREVPDDE